jgi:Na+/H+ antiporter NhaC
MNLEEVVDAWYKGVRSLMYAMIILVLAWALGGITDVLQTANFLVSILGDTLPVQTLPFLVFVIAAFTAFATGSSWGSMGILTPLVIPLTWAVMQANGYTGPEHMHILYSSIASVLAGSVWGDHCSPISDTTILSSMASGCDHIEHVRTQLPYALLVGIVALGAGSLPVAFGIPWWLGLLAGAAVLFTFLRLFGHKVGFGRNLERTARQRPGHRPAGCRGERVACHAGRYPVKPPGTCAVQGPGTVEHGNTAGPAVS